MLNFDAPRLPHVQDRPGGTVSRKVSYVPWAVSSEASKPPETCQCLATSLFKHCPWRQQRQRGVLVTAANRSAQETQDGSWARPLRGKGVFS